MLAFGSICSLAPPNGIGSLIFCIDPSTPRKLQAETAPRRTHVAQKDKPKHHCSCKATQPALCPT